MIVKTLNYDWEIKLYSANRKNEKESVSFYKYSDDGNDTILINQELKCIQYTLFESIFNLYCHELYTKFKYSNVVFKFILDNSNFILNYVDNNYTSAASFKINNFCFDIIYLTNSIFNERFNSSICCSIIIPDEYRIYINDGKILSKDAKVKTLLHECMHGLFYTLSDNTSYNSERLVDNYACILLHFIRENKEFVKALLLNSNTELLELLKEKDSCKE